MRALPFDAPTAWRLGWRPHLIAPRGLRSFATGGLVLLAPQSGQEIPMSDESRHARTARLRADCARCCGLCCAAPAFMAVQGFGFDKPAHTACRHLGADHRCVIHAELGMRGFPACSAFDCYGAGQRVTQLFAGKSWRSSPETAARMFTLYARFRALHELMALLDLAI